MTIQRFLTGPLDAVEVVLFTDHEADKAAAVAEAVAVEREKTEAMRAELVAAWSAAFAVVGYGGAPWRIHEDHTYNGVPTLQIADRLEALGVWERLDDDRGHQFYRPIEHRDSGVSDAS